MASRFWVGGTGTWNNTSTTNWASTSGGASGASAPTTADTVTFDSNSGTAAVVTVASTATCSTCTINKSDIELRLSGSPTITSTLTLTTGYLNLNSNTFTANSFVSSNTNTRRIGAGTLKLLVTGTFPINCADLTNLSLTGAVTIEYAGNGTTGTRSGSWGGTAGGSEANAVSISVTAGTDTFGVNSNSHIKNLNFTGFSGTASYGFSNVYGSLTLSAGMTNSGTGSVTFKPTSGSHTITSNGQTIPRTVEINAPGATYTLSDAYTADSASALTLTAGTLNLNGKAVSVGRFNQNAGATRALVFGGTQVNCTGSGVTPIGYADLTGLTITGTPSFLLSYSGGTGTRFVSWGNTAGGSSSNAATVAVSAATDTVSLNTSYIQSLTFTGFTGTANLGSFIYGNLTLSAGMTSSSGSGTLTFAGTSGTQTVTLNGVTINRAVTFNAPGAIVSFADAYTQGAGLVTTLTAGTIKLKSGTTNTAVTWSIAGSPSVTLAATTPGSQAYISQASGTVTASNATIQDINAIGGATWLAPQINGNVDAGNNAGWSFASGSSGLSDGVGLSAGSSGLWGGNSGLYGGLSGLIN